MATYTYEFNASNSIQKFIVPEGVLNLHIVCLGSAGASSDYATGGKGAKVECNLHVSPNQTLYVVAGLKTMPYNASDVRTNNSGITDSNSLKSRIIVAAGGGQAGDGRNPYGPGCGNGGNGGETGSNGNGSGQYAGGGKGATKTAAGSGGSGDVFWAHNSAWLVGHNGNAGSFGLGGTGSNSGARSNWYGQGGRGGAGWYGGGGGGSQFYLDNRNGGGNANSGGGGGGSSYVAGYCSSITYETGKNANDGKVIITHDEPILPEPIKAKTNRIITYTDLIADYLYWLQFNCANIDGYSSAVTDPFLSGYSSVIPNTTISIRIVENTVIPIITKNECENEINAYMEQCGLLTGENTIIKTVDILKYYNALASFSAAKLVTVSSQFANTVLTMYKKSNTVSPISLPTNILPVNNDIKNLATEFINLINKTTKMHVITYTIG